MSDSASLKIYTFTLFYFFLLYHLWLKCCVVSSMTHYYVSEQLKTGGLVVWGSKDLLAVYRGCNYVSGLKTIRNMDYNSAGDQGNSSSNKNYRNTITVTQVTSGGSNPDELIHGRDGKWENLQMASLYEREADRLLDELGPRFVDWWMRKPLPVDGDLLPAVVPGYNTPFRLCPPFTRAKLIDAELTYLRKLARLLPTHFVLGSYFLLLFWNIVLNSIIFRLEFGFICSLTHLVYI